MTQPADRPVVDDQTGEGAVEVHSTDEGLEPPAPDDADDSDA